MTDTNALRKLLAAATAPPWVMKYGPTHDQILAAVNSLPALLDELDALRARVAVLERVREAALLVRGCGACEGNLLVLDVALDAAKEAADGNR